MFRGLLFGFISLILVVKNSQAQDIAPEGRFLTDSIRIGESIPYALWVRYPRTLDVFFPDSLHSFAPFEFDRKRYFPTRSDSLYSYDSTVYFVTTFEIDSVQRLKLPVYVVADGDSSTLHSPLDSVSLVHMVTEVPDSVSAEAAPLKENTVYKRVFLQFNYLYWLIGLAIFLVLLVTGYLVFGNQIRRSFRLRRLKAAHGKFMVEFDRLSDQALQARIPGRIEALLALWKKYLEKLESVPYTKLTSREIARMQQNDNLRKTLKELDQAIYGDQGLDQLSMAFNNLRHISEDKYSRKIEEVKYGAKS